MIKPDISVILPLYNGIKYLSECVESIRSQSFENWELIVVSEFGNNDGSDEMLSEYIKMDSRITLLKDVERLGLSESLNIGINAARGKYIARVDADDPFYTQFDGTIKKKGKSSLGAGLRTFGGVKKSGFLPLF